MESLDDNLSTTDSILSEESRKNFHTIARWANFMAVMGFIGVSLLVIMGLYLSAIQNYQSAYISDQEDSLVIASFIFAIVYFFPIYYLFKFSRKMLVALDSKENLTFDEAIAYMKAHYQYVGILTTIVMSLYLLSFIFGLLRSFS